MHLIKWDRVCKHKKAGGLGIASIKIRITTLLEKWWWRYNTERKRLWIRTIESKYGDINDINQESRNLILSPIMKSIVSTKENINLKLISKEDFSWKAGNVELIKFWEDP